MFRKTEKIVQRSGQLCTGRQYMAKVHIETYWFLFIPIYLRETITSSDA